MEDLFIEGGGGDLFAVFKWAAIKGRAVIAAVKRHETLREKRGKSEGKAPPPRWRRKRGVRILLPAC